MAKTALQHRKDVEERLSSLETHIINIYHHVKRIEKLLEAQNGRVRKNENDIANWKGAAYTVLAIATLLSALSIFL